MAHLCCDLPGYQFPVAALGLNLTMDECVSVDGGDERSQGLLYTQFIVVTVWAVQLSPGIMDTGRCPLPNRSSGRASLFDLNGGLLQSWMMLDGHLNGLWQSHSLNLG